MNREFVKLVLNFIKKRGDNHEHDTAGRMLAGLESRDVQSAPATEQAVETTPAAVEPAPEPPVLPEMTQEPASQPVVEEAQTEE